MGIYDFQACLDTFSPTDILLGNGFSINLCQRLDYKSLASLFLEDATITMSNIFKGFNTSNFETVLEALSNTERVNEILGQDAKEIKVLKHDLKSGLIRTIQETHPKASEIKHDMLVNMARQLAPFNNVFTTNYDVLLYKIILASNDLSNHASESLDRFNDGFYDDISTGKLGFVDFDVYPRNLYYLHGALFLFAPRGSAFKLKKLDEGLEYIKLIKRYLEQDEFPLYVAEGNSEQKMEAINNNQYLSLVYRRFKNRKSEKLVTYGFSFGRSDEHITKAIIESNTKQLIISIRPKSDRRDLEREISRLKNAFGNISVTFYNSETLFQL